MKHRLLILFTLVSLWGCVFTTVCWVAAAVRPGQIVSNLCVWTDGPVVHRAVAGYRWNGSGVVVQRLEAAGWSGGPVDRQAHPAGPVGTGDLLKARRAEESWKLVPPEVREPQGRAPAFTWRRSFRSSGDGAGASDTATEYGRGFYLFIPFWLATLLLAALPLAKPVRREGGGALARPAHAA